MDIPSIAALIFSRWWNSRGTFLIWIMVSDMKT